MVTRVATSSTGIIQAEEAKFSLNNLGGPFLVHASTASNCMFQDCTIETGGDTAITIDTDATLTLSNCELTTTNATASSGDGTITYTGLFNGGGSLGITVANQTVQFEGPSKNIGGAFSGDSHFLSVQNTSDTASSVAEIEVLVGGSSAGDPTFHCNVSGVTDWTLGIDNDDSDAFVLSEGTALGTNNVIVATTAGEVTKPLTPSFGAYLASTASNVTGDATAYTIAYDTERYDVNADFNTSTGVFTASVTGKYIFFSHTNLLAVDATTTSTEYSLVTSNNTYGFFLITNGDITGGGLNGATVVDMDASDTASIVIKVTQASGKVVDVWGNISWNWFTGFLVG